MPFAGEATCLGAALLWAVSVAIFHRPIVDHGARTVNLVKCCLGAILQGATVLAVGQALVLAEAPIRVFALLAASGVVGLTFGDTALFASLARIGVHRTLLLQTLSPLFVALIAAATLGERLRPAQAGGAAIILAGVALVVAPRSPAGRSTWNAAGVGVGVLAALGQGGGVVLAKAGMQDTPVIAASFLRLAAGAAGLVVLALAGGRLRRIGGLLGSRAALVRVVPATVLGTYVALFLMMAGIALAPAAVAAVLLSTSPVFGLVVEASIERRLPTARGVAGTLLAVAGVALLTSVS